MQHFIGREKEKKRLEDLKYSYRSEFVAVYGRRRVGKTFLIREFFQYEFDFQLTGLANATTNQQLTNFHASLQRQSPSTSDSIPSNWFEAFQRLITYLEHILC